MAFFLGGSGFVSLPFGPFLLSGLPPF